jgi:hypothetical protein
VFRDLVLARIIEPVRKLDSLRVLEEAGVAPADGGKTSVSSCILLCQFHHDVCIHRWGWQIVLDPDGTTTAYGPDGQIPRSHASPTARAG